MPYPSWCRKLSIAAVTLAGAAALPFLASPGTAGAAPPAYAADLPDLSTPQVAYDPAASEPAKGVAARGADGTLLYSARSGTGFASFQSLGGIIVGDPSAVVTASGTELYVRGTDDRVYTNTVTASGAATGYSQIPGLSVTGEVESILPQGEPAGTVRIFARGQDGAVWTNVRRNGSWVGWSSLGGFITSEITAGRLFLTAAGVRIFVRGGDNRLYVTEVTPNGFSGFRPAGDVRVTSNIAVVEDRAINTGAEAFARGEDNRVWRFPLGVAPQPLNGVSATSDIAISTRTLYVRGPDNAIYANRRDIIDNRFTGFQRVNGGVAGNPAALALQPNGNDLPQYLLARQPNGTLGFNIQPNNNGTPGPFGGYTPIPGANVG